MRKLLAVGAAVVAVGLVGACSVEEAPSPGQGGGQGQQEISFLTFETPNLTPEVWDAAIKRVTDKHPEIKVNKLVAPTQDRTAYAKQLLASNQLPDVLVAVSPAGFAESGALYEWKQEELGEFLYPRNGAIGGKVYQLPANTQTIPVVYYNKKLFQQAGVTAPPKTYAELLDVAAKLKAAGITPFVIGGGKTTHDALGPTFAGILATEVYAKNPKWMADRRQGKVKFTDPEFTRAAQKLADLSAKGYIDKGMLSQDYAATQNAFLTGKGAMYAMGNWFAAAADDPKTKPDFEIGQFFWPSDDGKQVVSAFTGGGLLVNAKAKNLEAAKKFALAYQLDKTNLDTSCKADGLIPAIKNYSPPSDVGPVYREGFDMLRQAEAANAVVPAFGFEAGDDGMLVGVPEKWDAGMADLVTGQKSPTDVAAFLDTEWEKAS
ncbi:MAG TPA: extracellular solute-binding protein [Actinophytocola sp.]|uniref:extracellular solute-binding protein n=1 Tax=Actinophytocola sp. TaxID=1872138 RepID=UPI002DDCECB3|nr:extracellular solute-binding protein [Actinophytocola sp.]HEV2784547.1 extracellular solute-binding protein [Actinophytocola sp.]